MNILNFILLQAIINQNIIILLFEPLLEIYKIIMGNSPLAASYLIQKFPHMLFTFP